MISATFARTIGFITLILLCTQPKGSHQSSQPWSSSSDDIMDKLSLLLDEKLADMRQEITTIGETLKELVTKQDTMADMIEQKFARDRLEENLIKSHGDNISVLLPSNHNVSRDTTDPKYSLGQFHYYIISSLGDIKDNVGSIKMSQDISFAEIKESVNSVRTSQDKFITSMKNTVEYKCPAGFILIKSLNSKQCFKVLMESKMTWDASRTKCTEEGLHLAKPENPTKLVNRLLEEYGDGTNVWVDARPDRNGKVVWQRDQTELSADSSFWYPEHPHYLSTNYCVRMSIYEHSRRDHPGKPYLTQSCDDEDDYYPLCEALMDG